MTETHATTPAGAPVFPPGRYGRRRERHGRPRLVTMLVVAAVIAAGLAVATRLYQQYGDPVYDPQVVRFTGITDDQVIITFRVDRPAGRAAVCAVRARSRDGAVVGRAEVTVPADHAETTYRLPTTDRPVTGEVVRCRPTDP